jgi:hypothetical protein
MTNAVYDRVARQMLSAQFDWANTDLFLVAWTGQPMFIPDDEKIVTMTDRGGEIVGLSLPINMKMMAETGIAQSDTVLIPNVPIGKPITYFTMHEEYAVFDDSPPVFYIDDSLDLPFQPNGLDVYVQPDWLRQRGWFRP